MKLTKHSWDVLQGSGRYFLTKEECDIIKKNQEDAEKWREIEPRIVKPKWVNSTVNENKEIVERLKKLLEGRTDDFTFTGRYLRKEVLGEGK